MAEAALDFTGAITEAASKNETREVAQVLDREKAYTQAILGLFGPKDEPENSSDIFEPATQVEDSTTLNDLKPGLSNALQKGIEYWTAFKKAEKFSLLGEQQLTMHERALGFFNGERQDTRSFVETVEQMSAIGSVYADAQYKDRIDTLYIRESNKSPIWLGKLAYGKVGVLWNWGGREIQNYKKDYESHIDRVTKVALSGIPK